MSDSPFGSTVPEGLPPVQPSLRGAASVKTSGRKKVASARTHYPRVIKVCEGLFGGFFWTCDGKKLGRGGFLVSTDLLGFMDIQGVSEGSFVAVNVTSLAGVAAHLRAYTDPGHAHGAGRVPVENLLRRFLAEGGRMYVFGYEKRGTRWEYEPTEVTPDLLDRYKARKRGGRS